MTRSFIKKPGGVAERRVRDVCILVPISSEEGKLGSLYELNEVGSLIWEQAVTGVQEAELVERVLRDYEVSEAQATEDVKRILDELVELGALEEALEEAS